MPLEILVSLLPFDDDNYCSYTVYMKVWESTGGWHTRTWAQSQNTNNCWINAPEEQSHDDNVHVKLVVLPRPSN